MNLISCVYYVNDGTKKKYAIDADLGQEVLFQIWDYDAGLPGSENDDFLGRFWSILLFHYFYTFSLIFILYQVQFLSVF